MAGTSSWTARVTSSFVRLPATWVSWSAQRHDLADELGGLADLIVETLVDTDDDRVRRLDAVQGHGHPLADLLRRIYRPARCQDLVRKARLRGLADRLHHFRGIRRQVDLSQRDLAQDLFEVRA